MTQAVALNGNSPAAVVNDFSLIVATANGTGSQTSNLAILRAFFYMGIPVNGKNIFPSNIQGQPTWYNIRVSHEGYVAHRPTTEFLVAFNEATVYQDVAKLPAGGVVLYNGDWRSYPDRDDVITYTIPVKQFVAKVDAPAKIKNYLANMVYVGALAHLIDIPLSRLEQALDQQFGGHKKRVKMNMEIIEAAYAWAQENLEKKDPYRVAEMDETDGLIMITGNEAAALGSVFGGATFAAWYPITPSTSMIDALRDYMARLRVDPESGKNTFSIVQAEDELSAIGMVVGAGWMGARSLTSTSGPGISLMAEFAGLSYFAEIPAVIWDIQRVGPSTGLPTRTCQGDVIFSYYLGHGDTKNVVLLPGSMAECFEFGTSSLNLAEELQTLVLVLSDLDLGMNTWMTEPFEMPSEPIRRGKVVTAEQIAAQGSFARYKDVDGDGIPYRSLPGNEHPLSAYFARGTGHDENARYSEDADVWQDNMARLQRKFETARQMVPQPIIDHNPNASIGILAYGSTQFAIDEARDRLAADGIETSFCRVRALPISEPVLQFIDDYDIIYVVELNRDGQLHTILSSENPERATKLVSLAHLDGMPLTARWVVDQIGQPEKVA